MISLNENLGGKKPSKPNYGPAGVVCALPQVKRPLDSANHFGVTASGEQFGKMKMPVLWLARDECINLAAWLVTVADPEQKEFQRVLAEIKKS